MKLREKEPGEVNSNLPINIEYDGNLSQKMVWDLDKLAGFIKAADLRQAITIRRGIETPQTQYSNLGETLAWRRILNPGESLIKPQEKYEVDHDTRFARSEILINDQIIGDQVRQTLNGRFDEELFMRSFNTSFASALRTVAAKEKQTQLKYAGMIDSLAFGSIALGGYLLYSGITEPIDLWSSGQLNFRNTPTIIILELNKIIFGAIGLHYGGRVLGRLSKLWAERSEEFIFLHKYISSAKDLNPFKHSLDYAKCSAYLIKHGKDLITI